MAITSSAITKYAKSGISRLLVGQNTTLYYQAIGVGNNTVTANESDIGLKGTEVSFKNGNVSYFVSPNSSYIAQWNSSWVYADLTSHIFSEVAVLQNATNCTGQCLLRGVYDAVTLGSEDSISITAQVSVTESS